MPSPLPLGSVLVTDNPVLARQAPPIRQAGSSKGPGRAWAPPLSRAAFVLAVGLGVWFVGREWNSWIGADRYQVTDDAFVAGDLTPLSAKISGYVQATPVVDFAVVRQGDVLAEIEPSDYRAQLAQATANLAAADAQLTNFSVQKAIQRAIIRQAGATIASTNADVLRTHLEAIRQRDLVSDRLAGTPQTVEQTDAAEKRFAAQLILNRAALDQQSAALQSLDVQERQAVAQRDAARVQAVLAGNNLKYTVIQAPVSGMVGQRQVHPGQFVNIGTQIISIMPLPDIWVIANYKETQMTNIRLGDRARVTVDAFPGLVLPGHVAGWSPGTGSTFALLAPDNATGNFTKVVQRMPLKIVLDANPALGTLVRPGMSVEATTDTHLPPRASDGRGVAATGQAGKVP